MKHLERVRQCTWSCYREGVSFIDRDGYQATYQKVYIFATSEWHWLTFFGDIASEEYPQSHASLDEMRQYIRTQKPIQEGQKHS